MSYLFKFIENAVSYFHTVEQAKKKLKSCGFVELDEKKEFQIKPKGKYFVSRDDGALVAFIVPQKKKIKKAHFLLSHTDSPTFRIKPEGEFQKENMVFWGLEVYGGPIYSTWLNRNLGVAGRVYFEQNNKIKSSFVKIDKAPVIITQLPIHIDRKVNSEGLKINAQEHLNALVTLTDKKTTKTSFLESLLKKELKYKRLLNHELFLYPLDSAPQFLGPDQDLFSSPRIDNLASVSASLEALCQRSKSSCDYDLNMIYLASHEEVGSRTASGTDSPFLKNIFERIYYQIDSSFENMQQCLANSLALSIDGSHALDPKSKEHFEPRHTPLLGNGVTVKVDSCACYAYSAELIARINALDAKHKIKIQTYLKKGDVRQGSTIGPIFTKKLGVKTLDVGLAQLSMHASCEVASCRDYDQLVKLLGLVLKDQL
ncbi:MAG: putative M18 family aminopeptidase 2 [Chlamydiae bacterium]|nr:putative M18 family aminopeptidase 2 [Chlamydiota bacterium]